MENPTPLVDELLGLAGDGEPNARALYRPLIRMATKANTDSRTPPLASAVAHLLTALDLLTDRAVVPDDATAIYVMGEFAAALPLLRTMDRPLIP